MSEPLDLAKTAKAGVRLDTLRVLRDLLATEIETCDSSRDVAALSLRLMDILEQIELVEKTSGPVNAGTALDELADRRKAAGRPDATRKTGAGRSAK